jgi:hypothetical protein
LNPILFDRKNKLQLDSAEEIVNWTFAATRRRIMSAAWSAAVMATALVLAGQVGSAMIPASGKRDPVQRDRLRRTQLAAPGGWTSLAVCKSSVRIDGRMAKEPVQSLAECALLCENEPRCKTFVSDGAFCGLKGDCSGEQVYGACTRPNGWCFYTTDLHLDSHLDK